MTNRNLIVVTPWQTDLQANSRAFELRKQLGLENFDIGVIPMSPFSSDGWKDNLGILKKSSGGRLVVFLPSDPILLKAIASGIPHLVIDPEDGIVKKLVGVKPTLIPFDASELE